VLAALAATLVSLTAATGHPFGNSTINLYARLELGSREIVVRWVLDVAEVPALQLFGLIDANVDGQVSEAEAEAYLAWWIPSLLSEVELVVNGERLLPEVRQQTLTLPAGDDGAPTLRVVLDLVTATPRPAPDGAWRGTYGDSNYEDFIGWREVVVIGASDVVILESTAPFADRTDELRRYPDGLPAADANSSARFAFRTGLATATPVPPPPTAAPVGGEDDLTLLLRGLLGESPTADTFGLAALLAAGLGALHALSPGHGKTLVAGLLIGAHGSVPQAIRLALLVAVSHTVGVLLLGMVVLGASELLLPQGVVGALALGAALLVVGLGIYLVIRGIGSWRESRAAGRHGAAGLHPHPHRAFRLSIGHQVSLGLVGGLVPSGSALVVLLAAVILDQLVLGLAVIAGFGVGMGAVLAAVGAAVVLVRRRAETLPGAGHGRLATILSALPAASGLAVLLAGLLLSLQTIEQFR